MEIQQAIRFNLFHILQASARAEDTGVSAKGLTGQAYEGHYFWDTEIYLLPFLIYTSPRIAKNLLTFRYKMLAQARARARQLGHRGAMFPWRTINGEEASAYYAAGTAQYHINADIMYALRKYVQATGDEAFLRDYGAEMLVETARLWSDLGFYSDAKGGQFCINAVTGPDEYNTVVNNNAYTNLMARENLRYAAETVESLRSDSARCLRGPRAQNGARAVGGEGLDARGREHVRAVRREARDNPSGRRLPRPGTLGFQEHAAPIAIRCCCFTTRSTFTGSG